MTPRHPAFPLILASIGLTLTACEDKAADADLVALAERVAVLESQVGDAPTGDGGALADRVATLENDLGDAQQDISAATTMISENQIAIALNEDAIGDVEADLAAAERDITANETSIGGLGSDIAALGDSLTQVAADLAALVDQVDSDGAAIALLQEAYGDLAAQVGDIDTSISSIDLSAITSLVDGVSEDLDDLETALTADITDLQADVSDIDERGEVWYETGSGTGTCARATVTTTSDRPLMVFSTLTAAASGSDGCTTTASPGCYTSSGYSLPIPSVTTFGGSGTMTIDAQDTAGTYSYSESRSEQAQYTYRPNYTSAGSGGYITYIYSSYFGVSQAWTIPLNTVLTIPSAGTYIIDLNVTGFTGDCSLVVVQP